MQFLQSKKIKFLESRIVTLKSIFVSNGFEVKDNRLVKEDWYKIIDLLMVSNAFWDSKNNKIVFVLETNKDRLLKVTVAITAKSTPTIDAFSVIDFSASSQNPSGDSYSYKQISEMEFIR